MLDFSLDSSPREASGKRNRILPHHEALTAVLGFHLPPRLRKAGRFFFTPSTDALDMRLNRVGRRTLIAMGVIALVAVLLALFGQGR